MSRVERIGTQNIRLTSRDIQMLFAMYRNQFLTAHDVRIRFWNAKDTLNHYARIRALARAGFIERLKVFDYEDSAYRLTRSGFKILKHAGLVESETKYRAKSYSTQFEHDKLLSRVLWRLQKLPFVTSVENEQDMRVRYRQKIEAFKKDQDDFKIPDGRLLCKGSQSEQISAALELELTVKSLGRYSRVFKNYQRLNDWQFLLFVVRDSNTLAAMSRIIETLYKQRSSTTALCNTSPVCIALLDDILADPEKAPCAVRKMSLPLGELVRQWPIENPYVSTQKSWRSTAPLIATIKQADSQ